MNFYYKVYTQPGKQEDWDDGTHYYNDDYPEFP